MNEPRSQGDKASTDIPPQGGSSTGDHLTKGQLRLKQVRFIEEYLVDGNAARAARSAGYSMRSAGKIGYQLLEKTRIKDAIAALVSEQTERTLFNADDLLKRLVEEINAKLSDLFDQDGNIRPVYEWPEVWQRGLVKTAKVKITYHSKKNGGGVKSMSLRLSLYDRIGRLKLIGKLQSVRAFSR